MIINPELHHKATFYCSRAGLRPLGFWKRSSFHKPVVKVTTNIEDASADLSTGEMLNRRLFEGLLTRRQFLAAGSLAALGGPLAANLRSAPISEGKLPLEEAFGREMNLFMTERRIPGG